MEDWGLAHETIERAGTVTKIGSSPALPQSWTAAYLPAALSLAETRPNRLDRSVPIAFTAVMMATAMPAAIRPYSMAVAPDSSLMKRANEVLHFRHSL